MTPSTTNPRTTVYVIAAGTAAIAVAAVLSARGPLPAALPLVLLGGLFVWAENTSLELPNGASLSPSFILVMAAVLVFRVGGASAGPVALGCLGGLYLPHVRRFQWRKMLVNAGAFGLATAATTAAFLVVPHDALDRPVVLAAGALVSAVAFFAVNTLVVAGYYASERDTQLAAELRKLMVGHWQVYPFALLGVFLGRLYLDVGAIIVPLFVAPILVARQAFATYLALRESHEATVRILIGALEAKDPYTAGHAERVARYTEYIGLELGIPASRLERLRLAALMHDVGKLVVPNHLLNKQGKLTPAEYRDVRRHEDVSVEILSRIDFLAPVAPSATSEATAFAPVADERGQPIEPHIVAVADAFDAMTSTRSYRRALSQEVAFRELRENAGKQFHPRVVDALIGALAARGEVHGQGHEERVLHSDAPEAGTGSAGLGDLATDVPVGERGSR